MTFAYSEYSSYIFAGAAAAFLALLFFTVRRRILLNRITGGNSSMLRISGRARSFKTACLFVSVLLAAAAALGPQWGERTREVQNEGTDLLVALDVSRSMLAGEGRSRLDRAKSAIRWIAESMQGGRMGLMVFAGEAFSLCPMTTDTGSFLMFLDSAGPESVGLQGTDMGAVFDEALRLFRKKRMTAKIFLVVTDGEDHEGKALASAEKLKEEGVSVYCWGLGRKDPGPESSASRNYIRDENGRTVLSDQNSSLLKDIAVSTGGTYSDISGSFSGVRSFLSTAEDQQRKSFGTRLLREPVKHTAPFIAALLILLSAELLVSDLPLRSGRTGFSFSLKKIFRRSKEAGK